MTRFTPAFIRTKARGVFVFYTILGLFLLIAFRLAQVQVIHAKEYRLLADRQYSEEIPLRAKRSSILDRNGNPLAESLLGSSVAANPRQVVDGEGTARVLAEVLKRSPEALLRKLKASTYFVWLARKVSDEEARRIAQMRLAGVEVISEPTGRRYYPKGGLAAAVLGYTGVDDQGLEGMEYQYDRFLRGVPGKIQAERDAFGRAIPNGKWEITPVANGRHLASSIDETIQYLAERELLAGLKETRARSGVVIVMDPRSGEVLAMASMQGSLPSTRNAAIADAYEPGSTFKTVLVTAALDSGKVSPTEKFYSGSSIVVGERIIHNADDGLVSPTGQEDVSGILTYSFNVGAVSLGQKLGAENFHRYLERFEMLQPTGIDLPGEGRNLIPPLSEWTPLQLSTISYGHGIAVTPLQLLRVYAAVANGGWLVTPRIGRALVDDRGEVKKILQFPSPRRVISPGTAELVRGMLRAVVEEGTGKKARIPGYLVAGKTGTAQVVENGKYVQGKYVASFVGFVPADDPVLAILVKVDEPKTMIWGGAVAAPIFQRIGREALWRLRVSPAGAATRKGGSGIPSRHDGGSGIPSRYN